MTDPEMPPTPLTLIVAATPKNGIGKNGSLPWPMLKKEMAYFARVTKRLPPPPSSSSQETSRRNAVIMGRKTWASIPPKFRPLKDRTNIVVSSLSREELEGATDEVIVAGSIQAGLADLEARAREGRSPALGRAFVIGGAGVYGAALGLEGARNVLLTRVGREYECDTFFPDLEAEGWERRGRGELEEFVGEDVGGEQVDGEVGFEVQLWRR